MTAVFAAGVSFAVAVIVVVAARFRIVAERT